MAKTNAKTANKGSIAEVKAEAQQAKAGNAKPAAPSPADNAAKVAELLKKLENETSPLVKKRIRRSLRALGHKGGIGKRKAKAAE